MQKIKCSFCGKDFSTNEIFGFFPEDDSYLCKNCYGKSFQKNFFHKKGKTTKDKTN